MSTARASFLSAPRCISATITTADLTAAANSQTITLADKIPAGAIVIARYVNLVTEFSGGGAGAVSIDLGDQADGDGWYDAQNVFTGAGTGIKSTPLTAAPATAAGAYLAAGQACDVLAVERTITVKFDADVNVKLLTAGSLGVNVFYVEQAAGDLPA